MQSTSQPTISMLAVHTSADTRMMRGVPEYHQRADNPNPAMHATIVGTNNMTLIGVKMSLNIVTLPCHFLSVHLPLPLVQ